MTTRSEYIDAIKKKVEAAGVPFSVELTADGKYANVSIGYTGRWIGDSEFDTTIEDPRALSEAEEEAEEFIKSHQAIAAELAKTTWDGGNTLYDALHDVGDDPVKSAIATELQKVFADQPDVLDKIAKVFKLYTMQYDL